MKKVALALSLVIMLNWISPLYVNAEYNEQVNSDYCVYDVETQEMTYHSFDEVPDANDCGISPGYFPEGMIEEDAVQPCALVGSDDRVRINPTNVGPYCNTVYIEVTYSDNTVYKVSAFMLGPTAVLTAAHCVYSHDKGGVVASSVKVTPAKNGSLEPYGSANSTNIIVSYEYTQNRSSDHDWAIIIIDEPLGNTTGWLGLRWQSASYNGTTIQNTGYPSPSNAALQNSNQTYMLCGEGTVRVSNTYTLEGDWDATGGNSGGPVFAYYSGYGYVAIGILTAGTLTDGEEYPESYSIATRITEDMYNLFIFYTED